MFIREKSKKSKGKKRYIQHQLIESIRTSAGPRQQIVLNLGRLHLLEEKWKELANCIEGLLTNQRSLLPQDPEIEAKARHYANRIRQERLVRTRESVDSEETAATRKDAQYEQVDIKSLVTNDAKTIGAEHVAISQMDEYGFDKILKGLNFTDKQIVYAKMLIAGRMLHPGSERETARWLCETSGVGELLGSQVKVYDTALHRTAVLLWENHVAIEQELSNRAREIFSLKETVILYDLTNTYFEGSKRGSAVARHGKSKEKRNDCPLITLSLTIDEDGFPKQSKVWKGNVSEPDTLEEILSGLKKEESLFPSQRTIVMDAGIATEDNMALIKKNHFKYVAVSRKRTYDDSFWSGVEDEKITLSDGKMTLSMKLVRTEEEVFLLCHSEAKEAKESAILLRREEKFEQELLAIKEGLKEKRKLKKYDKIMERIGRFKERYKVGNLYTINVKQTDGKVTDIQFEKNEQCRTKESSVGTYVLRTNRLDLCAEEISKLHRSLTTVEESFRNMKGHLGLRPNFHHDDIPTIAHAHVTVLAYHMLAGILKKLRSAGIHYNWNTIRNILGTHVRVTTTMNTEDGHVIDVRTCTTPTEKQHTIYNKLHIKHTP
ncbi:MAG: IS1634 family transposase, partial [Cytophagales bacterium]|nr:IS1634 family transposase [Cytophagales bacterium]